MGEGLFSPTHMIIVLLIVFFLFGAKKLPELGKSMGTGIREFKNGLSELHADADNETIVTSTQAPAAGTPSAIETSAAPVVEAGAAPTAAPTTQAGPAQPSVDRTQAPAE